MLRFSVIFWFGFILSGLLSISNTSAREISVLEDLSIHKVTHVDWSVLEQYDGMQREISAELDPLDPGNFLIVGLKSKFNLTETQEKGSHTWSKSWFCQIPDTVAYLAFPSIFMGMVDISALGTMWFLDGGSRPSTSSANRTAVFEEEGSYIYEIILKTDWIEEIPLPEAFRRDKSQENFLIYDLAEEPMDICFYLNVGPLKKSKLSKILMLDKDTIRRVLSREN